MGDCRHEEKQMSDEQLDACSPACLAAVLRGIGSERSRRVYLDALDTTALTGLMGLFGNTTTANDSAGGEST